MLYPHSNCRSTARITKYSIGTVAEYELIVLDDPIVLLIMQHSRVRPTPHDIWVRRTLHVASDGAVVLEVRGEYGLTYARLASVHHLDVSGRAGFNGSAHDVHLRIRFADSALRQ